MVTNFNETGCTATVLIVDDDPVARALHRVFLSKRFDVLTAASGEDAISMCKENLPDLVLLDVSMPVLDGYETCKKLREWTDTPIIFATSHKSIEEHLKAYEVGGDDIITKPVEQEILLNKASLAIRRHNDLQKLGVEKDNLQTMAMNFLSAIGEGSVLQKFMRNSLKCSSHVELGEKLVEAVIDYGLQCCVRIHHNSQYSILSSQGKPGELESSILNMSANMGRIFQFHRQIVVNYDHVTIVINNLPEDAEKAGRFRDNIALLAELTESMCENVDMRQTSISRAEQMLEAMSSAETALESLRNKSHSVQMDIRLLLQELMDHIEESYTWLGVTLGQEKAINATMHASVDKILQYLIVNAQFDEQFDKVMRVLHGSNAGKEMHELPNKKMDI